MVGRFTAVAILFLTLAIVFLTGRGAADEWNKQTLVSFNREVEIPGGEILPPGKYVFKLLDAGANHTIVQIFSEDQRHIYATIEAIVKYRSEPSDKTVMTFEVRSAGSPQAIRAWFYPGSNKGLEFLYPKQREVKVAKLPPPAAKPLVLAGKAGKRSNPGHQSHRTLAKKTPAKMVPPASVAEVPEKAASTTEITVWGPPKGTASELKDEVKAPQPESAPVPNNPGSPLEKSNGASGRYLTALIIGFVVSAVTLLAFLRWFFKAPSLPTAADSRVIPASSKPPGRVKDVGSRAA
jgi:hypothetical protein